MKRKALLITNPGKSGSENYCEGVYTDLQNFREYLLSARGGVWYDSEIESIDKPTVATVTSKIGGLSSYDYSFVGFFGHGYFSSRRVDTILELNPSGDEIASNALKIGATKRTILLDCCRVVIQDAVALNASESRMGILKFADHNLSEYRKKFDGEIARLSNDLIVLYGCSSGEKAGDSASLGGRYTSSLLSSAKLWSPDIRYGDSDSMSVVSAHNTAVPVVRTRSGGLQNPDIEKSRTGPYFPFAVEVK